MFRKSGALTERNSVAVTPPKKRGVPFGLDHCIPRAFERAEPVDVRFPRGEGVRLFWLGPQAVRHLGPPRPTFEVRAQSVS
jgi:hypothetical protein